MEINKYDVFHYALEEDKKKVLIYVWDNHPSDGEMYTNCTNFDENLKVIQQMKGMALLAKMGGASIDLLGD